jgi:hypothetical protein
MSLPYLAILRELLSCQNCFTALVLNLKYFSVFHFLRLLVRMHLIESFTLYLYSGHILHAASVFFVLPYEYRCGVTVFVICCVPNQYVCSHAVLKSIVKTGPS